MNAFAHRADNPPKDVISVFSVKFTRKFSKSQKAKARAKLAKALRKQGILGQYTGNIWLTLSLGKHTEKQVTHAMLACTLRAHTVEQLDLHGNFSFKDFFTLNKSQAKYSAEEVARRWGVRLAQSLIRVGGIASPAGHDLQRSLFDLARADAHVSRLIVSFGE